MAKDYSLLQSKLKLEKPYKYYFIDTNGEPLSKEGLDILHKYKERFEEIGIKFHIKESLNIKDAQD